ncbi:MAG: indole-3-glycerol phosphate synthase TrpC [Rhodospirillaceae bacterium]|nr:indole-3-glycerol phosphate synthase TrpC [Rhodospirillaceae bacterium]
MGNVLDSICDSRRAHYAQVMAKHPLSEVEDKARSASPVRGFGLALSRATKHGHGLIAEIKKASPSAGLVRRDFNPTSLAQAYEAGGATCLSVLTETENFQGSDAFLQDARGACTLPVLRKDFMLDPYQVVEARAIGADCILLIMACLSDSQALELEACAYDHDLDVLIEVHDEAELDRAFALRSPLVGINNRNLKTLTVDLNTTERLAARLPSDRVLVSESGLKTSADLSRLASVGARRFLIGESLMRQDDVEAATRALLANPVPAATTAA